ncbi:MAG: hypothetical protein ACXVLQ_01640 [Bacteriovorax sp.]
MKKYLLILAGSSILFSAQVFAKEEVLAIITNDDNKDVFTFVANADDTGQSLKGFFKDDYVDGKKIEREVLPTKDLSKNGLVLDKRKDLTIINLKSDNFDYQRGGTVTIDTLYNGVTGERKQYEVEIAKDQNGWKLFNKKNVVSKLHIEVNKKAMIGAVGVKNIRME